MTKVARTKENLERCQCMDCPSYSLSCKIKAMPSNLYKLMKKLDDTEHFEGMFCAYEKSHCITASKGCLCTTCEIFHKYDLSHQSYCLSDGGLPIMHPQQKHFVSEDITYFS